jgi:tetratricopeptide (TPR) repeat protein
MKKLIFTIILFISSVAYSCACLNGYNVILKEGVFLTMEYRSEVPSPKIIVSNKEIKKLIIKFDSFYKATKNLEYLSDKGILLIYDKQYKEAIELYLTIEKIKPNKYSTASNLGTTYELIGDNINALKWIKKAVEIDSSSHDRSEWIHINILKAKIKGNNFINSSFLINSEFGNDTLPKSNLSESELIMLHLALGYQLGERMTFIVPKDKIVAELLFELGNIMMLRKSYSFAIQNYEHAKEDGFTDSIIDIRIKKLINIATPKMYT